MRVLLNVEDQVVSEFELRAEEVFVSDQFWEEIEKWNPDTMTLIAKNGDRFTTGPALGGDPFEEREKTEDFIAQHGEEGC